MAAPIKPLVDRILAGKLDQYLAEGRADNQSYDAIARRLATEHDITVSGEQVRRWCLESAADSEPAA